MFLFYSSLAHRVYALYTFFIYSTCSITLPVMRAYYPDVDPGFCVLMVVNLIYYLCNAMVVYQTIIRDSKYVIVNGLDDSLSLQSTEYEHALHSEAEHLVQRQKGGSNLLELISNGIILIKEDEIVYDKKVGSGAFGDVYKVNYVLDFVFTKSDSPKGSFYGCSVAVKKLRNLDCSIDSLEEFVKEVKILSQMRHPNCLLLIGLILAKDEVGFVTEYCEYGSLWDVLHRRNKVPMEKKTKVNHVSFFSISAFEIRDYFLYN